MGCAFDGLFIFMRPTCSSIFRQVSRSFHQLLACQWVRCVPSVFLMSSDLYKQSRTESNRAVRISMCVVPRDKTFIRVSPTVVRHF